MFCIRSRSMTIRRQTTQRAGARRVLALFIGVPLLGSSVLGCGNTGSNSSSSASKTLEASTVAAIAPVQAITKADSDRDSDFGGADDTSNASALNYARPASATDQQAIAALVKRYYTAALAGDGAAACSLIYSTLEEAVPEDYGQSPPGPTYMSGTTCPAVLNGLFKHYHNQLAVEVPKLEVARVRLKRNHGWAILTFGSLPEREILVSRERHRWKLGALLDTELP